MPVAFEVDAYQIDLIRIVEEVFGTMLDTEVVPLHRPGPEEADSLTTTVQFVGEWRGAVLLHCAVRQALAFTHAFMPRLEPSRVDEDVRDVLGELANMVGGNLKSVLPRGVVLSMPQVVHGSDYALHICGSNPVKTVRFTSDLGVFSVSLVQIADPGNRK